MTADSLAESDSVVRSAEEVDTTRWWRWRGRASSGHVTKFLGFSAWLLVLVQAGGPGGRHSLYLQHRPRRRSSSARRLAAQQQRRWSLVTCGGRAQHSTHQQSATTACFTGVMPMLPMLPELVTDDNIITVPECAPYVRWSCPPPASVDM